MRMVRVREKAFRNSIGFRFNVSLVDCTSLFVKSVLECYAGNLLAGSLQTKLNAGLSEQQQEYLFQK